MSTPPTGQPMTEAALRSLLWGGAPNQPKELPRAEDLDDLTLAKIRLLQMRRPASHGAAAVLHNPVPWALGAFILGAVASRSSTARKALLWTSAKVAKRTLGGTAAAFVQRKAKRPAPHRNGRQKRRPPGWGGRLLELMKSAS